MKRRTRSQLLTRAPSTRLSLPRALPVFKAAQNVALQTLRANGNGWGVGKPLECHAPRRFHMFPKGAALFQMMGRDTLRRLLDLI